ncbi:MAG TPA: FecR domain-containing protein [Bacteroidales bacterium]
METFEREDIVRIISNYLAGNALEDDIIRLKEWINLSPENKRYYHQLKYIWDASGQQFKPSDISSEEALKKVLVKISKDTPKHGLWFYWQRIAAILLIPLLIGGLVWSVWSGKKGPSTRVVYNEVFASYGTRSALRLADGSQVWLNAGSSLKYPDRFTEAQRVVYLKGEAYFEVKSDVSRPFIVQTQTLRVRATGTKFNVQAFDNDHVTEVTLVEGKVAIAKLNDSGKITPLSVLTPNQHLVYDNNSGTTRLFDEDAYRYIAWKDGKLIFRNQPMSEVVKKISQLYHVDIELHGTQLQEYRYRATFQEESLSEILKLLKLSSPIDYREVARNPLPDGSFPKRKIIIFPVNESTAARK